MKKTRKEAFKVTGSELLEKVKMIIREGNARRIIIKNSKSEAILEVPLTIGAVGVLVAPMLAAIGAMAALIGDCTIEVERK